MCLDGATCTHHFSDFSAMDTGESKRTCAGVADHTALQRYENSSKCGASPRGRGLTLTNHYSIGASILEKFCLKRNQPDLAARVSSVSRVDCAKSFMKIVAIS